jgi:hypothetical protein
MGGTPNGYRLTKRHKTRSFLSYQGEIAENPSVLEAYFEKTKPIFERPKWTQTQL